MVNPTSLSPQNGPASTRAASAAASSRPESAPASTATPATTPDAPTGAHGAAPRSDATTAAPLSTSAGILGPGLRAPTDLEDSGQAGNVRYTPSAQTRKPFVQAYLRDPAFRELELDFRPDVKVPLGKDVIAKLVACPIVSADLEAFVGGILLGSSGLHFRKGDGYEALFEAMGRGGVSDAFFEHALPKFGGGEKLKDAFAAGKAQAAPHTDVPTSSNVVALKPLDAILPAVSPEMIATLNGLSDKLIAALGGKKQNAAFSVPALVASLNQFLVGADQATIKKAVLEPLGVDMTPDAFVRELQSVQAYLGSIKGVAAATAFFTKTPVNAAYRASIESGLGSVVGDLAGKDVKTAAAEMNGEIAKRTEVKGPDGAVIIPGMTDLVPESLVEKCDMFSVATLTTQGDWKETFDKEKSKEGDFAGPTGASKATLMTSKRKVRVAQEGNMVHFQLPMQTGAYYEYTVPAQGGAMTQASRAKLFAQVVAAKAPQPFQFGEETATIAVPRSKISADYNPIAALRTLGVKLELLSLSGIDPDPHLQITDGVARTVSLRNEKGGATTNAVVMGPSRSISMPMTIDVNVGHTVKLKAPNGLTLVGEICASTEGIDPGPAS